MQMKPSWPWLPQSWKSCERNGTQLWVCQSGFREIELKNDAGTSFGRSYSATLAERIHGRCAGLWVVAFLNSAGICLEADISSERHPGPVAVALFHLPRCDLRLTSSGGLDTNILCHATTCTWGWWGEDESEKLIISVSSG